MSQGFAFELRMTDVSAEGRPSHTWPLLTMGKTRDYRRHLGCILPKTRDYCWRLSCILPKSASNARANRGGAVSAVPGAARDGSEGGLAGRRPALGAGKSTSRLLGSALDCPVTQLLSLVQKLRTNPDMPLTLACPHPAGQRALAGGARPARGVVAVAVHCGGRKDGGGGGAGLHAQGCRHLRVRKPPGLGLICAALSGSESFMFL